jgi:hypothetical protein
MSRDDAHRADCSPNRRQLLKAASAAIAAGTGLAAVGTASASDHCYYEYDCVETICPDGGGFTETRRECCEDADGNVTCGDAEDSGCC